MTASDPSPGADPDAEGPRRPEPGGPEPGRPEPRIGNREREIAMGVLDEHWRAGRLDAPEFSRRSADASRAAHRSELDPLFADLPAPHPVYPAGVDTAPPRPAPAPGYSGPTPPVPAADPAPPTDGPRPVGRDEEDLPELVLPSASVIGRHAGLISLMTPAVAAVLFAATGFRFPQIFVLVPVVLVVVAYLGHEHGS